MNSICLAHAGRSPRPVNNKSMQMSIYLLNNNIFILFALAAMEGAYYKKFRRSVELSEQDFVGKNYNACIYGYSIFKIVRPY